MCGRTRFTFTTQYIHLYAFLAKGLDPTFPLAIGNTSGPWRCHSHGKEYIHTHSLLLDKESAHGCWYNSQAMITLQPNVQVFGAKAAFQVVRMPSLKVCSVSLSCVSVIGKEAHKELLVDFADSSQGKTALLVYEWQDFDLVGRTMGNDTVGGRVRAQRLVYSQDDLWENTYRKRWCVMKKRLHNGFAMHPPMASF